LSTAVSRNNEFEAEPEPGSASPAPAAGARNMLLRGATALIIVLRVAAGAMLFASVSINFANIIGRYFFSVSIWWAEEVMIFLMIGCVFLGIGPVGWFGRHIRMDAVVQLLPPRMRAAFEIFSDLATIATCVMLAVFALPVVTMLAQLNERSDTANIPLAIPQSVLPIGLLIMALLIAVRLMLKGVRHEDDMAAHRSER
jgi:TRAP-type C4-dicarboxylate transport system permease small subunit